MTDSVKEAEDTGLSDATDTSNDEGLSPEDALLDVEVSDDDLREDSEESSNEEAATESEDSSEDESEDDVQEEKAEEEDTTSEDERRRHNDEFAKRRIAERDERRRELEQTKAQQQEEYLQAAGDERDLAVRQLQIDAYNNRVDSNVSKLESGIERAIANVDLFDKGSPEQKEYLANSLDDFERMYVVRDSNGDPTEVKGDVYQYLQAKADEARRLAGVGARAENRAKAQTKARTDIVPTRAPKERKDPYLDAFTEEADRP